MSKEITVTEFRRRLSHYLNQVAADQETLLLKRRNTIVAEVRFVREPPKLRDLPALFDALPRLGPEEAEAFARDIEEGREWINSLPLRDPWEE